MVSLVDTTERAYVTVWCVILIIIILYQNIHGDSLPPPFIIFLGETLPIRVL